MPNQLFIRITNVAKDVIKLAVLAEKSVTLNGSVSSFLLIMIVAHSAILGSLKYFLIFTFPFA